MSDLTGSEVWTNNTPISPGVHRPRIACGGYEAVTDKGQRWVRVELSRLSVATESVCDELRSEIEEQGLARRFYPVTFTGGCSAAIESMMPGS